MDERQKSDQVRRAIDYVKAQANPTLYISLSNYRRYLCIGLAHRYSY